MIRAHLLESPAWGRRSHTFKYTTHSRAPESALGEKETSLQTVYPDVSLNSSHCPRIISRDSELSVGWILGIDEREWVHNFTVQTTGATEMISACFPNWTNSIKWIPAHFSWSWLFRFTPTALRDQQVKSRLSGVTETAHFQTYVCFEDIKTGEA